MKEPEKKKELAPGVLCSDPNPVGHRDRRQLTRAQQGHVRRDTGLGEEGGQGAEG